MPRMHVGHSRAPAPTRTLGLRSSEQHDAAPRADMRRCAPCDATRCGSAAPSCALHAYIVAQRRSLRCGCARSQPAERCLCGGSCAQAVRARARPAVPSCVRCHVLKSCAHSAPRRPALIPFICAGDPNLATTALALRALDEARLIDPRSAVPHLILTRRNGGRLERT